MFQLGFPLGELHSQSGPPFIESKETPSSRLISLPSQPGKQK